MTKAEKAERRKVKNEFRKRILHRHFREYKRFATTAQLKAAARVVADQMLAGKPQP